MELELSDDDVAIQCCQKHWDMTRDAVELRGMGHLISATGEKAVECFEEAREVQQPPTDPLMLAFTLMAQVIVNNGIPEETLKKHRECLCPVCTAMSLAPEPSDVVERHWTSDLADEVLKRFRERGLMPRLQ